VEDGRVPTRFADGLGGRLARLSPRRRVVVLAVVLLVATSAAALGVALGVRHLGNDPPRAIPPQDRPGPVLLVPGYGGGVAALSTLTARIRATGREAIVVDLAGDGTGDLRAQAAALDRQVEDALARGAPSVDVIGYSAGGVVARLWLQNHDGAYKARRIITLGSPHHGTTLAAAGSAAAPGACPIACRQLAPGSELLTGLRTPVPIPPAWLSVWTVQDQTVTPPESSRLDGAVNVPVQSICPDLRLQHSELPGSAMVVALVLDAIGPDPLVAPDPLVTPRADCVSS
jgi:triacylglycerol lipase